MRGHTAQHLLHWAFTKELATRGSDDKSATEPNSSSQPVHIHPGGRVEPDRCYLHVTLVETPEKLERLVQHVEVRCHEVIKANLPIVSQEVEFHRVAQVFFTFHRHNFVLKP